MISTPNGLYESYIAFDEYEMAIFNIFTQLQTIWKKLKIFAKIGDFFDESALFKGMKSHDADPGGVNL